MVSSCVSKRNINEPFQAASEPFVPTSEISETPNQKDLETEFVSNITFEQDIIIDEPALDTEMLLPPSFVSEQSQLAQLTEELTLQSTVQQPDQEPEQLLAQQPSQFSVQPSQPPEQQLSQFPVQSSQPPAQQPVQSPVQSSQTPAQQPARPPVQSSQPPAQQPARPPAQSSQPQVLPGSAEERAVVQYPQRQEPLRDFLDDAAIREQSVAPAQSIVVPRQGDIVFSRIVRATTGQIIEIPFNGTGWVYLGEIASRRGIVYNSRRIDPEGQSFIFRAEESGTFALKFFKQDFIRDYILNDHVQVIVGEAPQTEGAGWFNPPVDHGRVVAQPRWPSAVEEAEIQRGGTSPAAQISARDGAVPSARETVPQQSSSSGALPESQENFPPDVLLQKAKETFDGGNVTFAITLLDQFAQHYPFGSDELYWLYGQFYEANSPERNILLSIDYYRRLVREFPQSVYGNDARSRITYLERFYINIR